MLSACPSPRCIRNAWVCRIEAQRVDPLFADLFLEAGTLREVRPADFRAYLHRGTRRRPPRPIRDELDAGGRVLTPPLANFHEHLYSRLAKGASPGGPMDSFVHILENLWWRIDRALDLPMVEACARLGAAEALRSGVTYVFDHHASPGCIDGSLNCIGGVLEQAGLRGVLCFEASDRYGPEGARHALEENKRFIAAHRDGELRGLLGLHASFTLGEQTLQAAAALVQELGCGIHIHLAEDRHDREQSRLLYGLPPAARLKRSGLLSPGSILAHGVDLTPQDREAVAESGAAVAYNPESNLNNAVGLPEFSALPVRVPLLAGTDGMHANPARSLKQLFLLSRHQGRSSPESFQFVQKVFFDQLAFVRRFFPDYPGLKPGERADLVLWEYRPPTPFSESTFWGHYIYGILESAPAAVLQGGRLLLAEGRLLCLDEARAAAEAAVQGERLFERLGGGHG